MPDDRSRAPRGPKSDAARPDKPNPEEPWSDKTNAEPPRWSDKTPADGWGDRTGESEPGWTDKTQSTGAAPTPAQSPWQDSTTNTTNPNKPAWAGVTDPNPQQSWVDRTDPNRWEPEKTETRPPAPLRSFSGEFRLACVSGPTIGQEFKLEGGEVVIGRGSENPICLPDHSVSRKHTRLKKREGDWYVSDISSGNGTLVNGEEIHGEQRVKAGDVITIGESRLMVMDSDKTRVQTSAEEDRTITGEDDPAATQPLPAVSKRAPAPAPDATQPLPADAAPLHRPTMTFASPLAARQTADLPNRRGDSGAKRRVAELPSRARQKREADRLRKRRLALFWAAGIISLFLIPVFISATVRVSEQRRREAERLAKEQIDVALSDGMNALRAGKWEAAKSAFEKAKRLDPTSEVANLIDRADRGAADQSWLDAANTAISEGQLGKAAEALGHITSATGPIRETLRDIRQRLAERARQRIVQARGALEAGRADEAAAVSGDVLRALPDNRDARAVHDDALARLRH